VNEGGINMNTEAKKTLLLQAKNITAGYGFIDVKQP